MNTRFALSAFILLVLTATVFSQSKPAADLILTHARIYTVDKSHPEAEAVAVIGERIVAVGTDAEISAWRGPQTKVIDAQGHRVLPGFNDSHVHLTDGGAALDAVQLNDVTNTAEFVRRIAEQAKKTPKGEWMLNGNWDETKWTPPNLPTRQMIDAVTGDIPVLLDRYDGHMVLANTAALKLIGITAATKDPDGGVIVRDANGEPTGALKDAAEEMGYRTVPPLSHEAILRRTRRALQHAASLGVTSMQFMSTGEGRLTALADLERRGELTARIYVAPPITLWGDQAKVGLRHAFGSSWLRAGALKAFADGSLGSRTAYFFDGFTDEPQNHGLLNEGMFPISAMQARFIGADAAGLQLCTHAIGDRGISTILDLYENVVKTNGGNATDRRFRIEHAQHMAAKDFDRFAKLGVIASMQPYHAIDDGRWAEPRIGHDRASRTYAFRTFLDHGVKLAFGTDWPVAPLNPLYGIFAAVTRRTLDGKNPGGWFPEQKLTVAEAVDAYTMGSAYAEFQENEKGSITKGKLADMVILSDDIFKIAPEKIWDVTVTLTLVGGTVIYKGK